MSPHSELHGEPRRLRAGEPKVSTRGALYLGLLAVAFHGLFLAFLPGEWRVNNSYDYERFYEPVGERIADGKGITESDGSLATRYPPGYPILLAGVFQIVDGLSLDREFVLRIFVSITVWLNVFLATLVASRFFSRRTVILSSLLLATYPFYLWLTKQPNSENAFISLFLISVLFLERLIRGRPGEGIREGEEGSPIYSKKWAILCGLVCGVMSLIRPISIVISIVYVLILRFGYQQKRRQSWVSASLLLVLGNAVALLPWEAVVYHETGRIIPLSTGGAPSILDGLTFTEIPSDQINSPWVPEDVSLLMKEIYGRRLELDTTSRLIDTTWTLFQERPIAMIKLIAIKTIRSWYATNMTWHEGVVACIQSLYLILGTIGLFLLWRRGHPSRLYVVLVGGIIIYFWAMTVIALSILRYMIPVMPLLMPAVATTVFAWTDRWKSKSIPAR